MPSGVSYLSRLGVSLKPYQRFRSVVFPSGLFIISVYSLIANHLKQLFHLSKMVHLSWFGKSVVRLSRGRWIKMGLSSAGLWTPALIYFRPWHLLLWQLLLMICYQQQTQRKTIRPKDWWSSIMFPHHCCDIWRQQVPRLGSSANTRDDKSPVLTWGSSGLQ